MNPFSLYKHMNGEPMARMISEDAGSPELRAPADYRAASSGRMLRALGTALRTVSGRKCR